MEKKPYPVFLVQFEQASLLMSEYDLSVSIGLTTGDYTVSAIPITGLGDKDYC